MFDKLLEIAKNSLENVDKNIVGLPEPQVTVLLTANKNFYVAVNDIDGLICEELKYKKDTKIYQMLTMWNSGQVDLSSIKFRKALIELDKSNNDTNIILQGKDGLIIKKLSATIS